MQMPQEKNTNWCQYVVILTECIPNHQWAETQGLLMTEAAYSMVYIKGHGSSSVKPSNPFLNPLALEKFCGKEFHKSSMHDVHVFFSFFCIC